jgi:hypothetical protein
MLRTITSLAALALSCVPSAAQREALPFRSRRGACPSGYYLSGGFCTPLDRNNHPAVPRPPGASCPSGWYASGEACVRLNR